MHSGSFAMKTLKSRIFCAVDFVLNLLLLVPLMGVTFFPFLSFCLLIPIAHCFNLCTFNCVLLSMILFDDSFRGFGPDVILFSSSKVHYYKNGKDMKTCTYCSLSLSLFSFSLQMERCSKQK